MKPNNCLLIYPNHSPFDTFTELESKMYEWVSYYYKQINKNTTNNTLKIIYKIVIKKKKRKYNVLKTMWKQYPI
jgi:hypothetical protein